LRAKTGHHAVVENLGERGAQAELLYAKTLVSHGYPPAFAKVRAESAMTAPRRPETTLAFETLVRDVFVPPLKRAGFAKTRNVWRRQLGSLRNVVDIQRSHATGDLLRFSSNWSVLVPGFEFEFRRDVVVGGRIGEFMDGGLDRWWSIQLGWLAADFPEVDDDSQRCREDIASGLARMIGWLDEIDSVATLIETLERRDPVPFRQYDQRALHDLAVALGTFRDAP
jgi:hypothetical protein